MFSTGGTSHVPLRFHSIQGGFTEKSEMDLYSWLRRNKKTPVTSATTNQRDKKEEEDELYGVTDELIDLIKSFTIDTFRNFPLQDDESVEGGAPGASGNIQKVLSDWQERHAILVLSKVKELSQLRFRLCPGYLKERHFWRVYFSLVKTCLNEYELRAVRLEKLRQMATENKKVSDTSACEVEMLETTKPTRVEAATSFEQNSDS